MTLCNKITPQLSSFSHVNGLLCTYSVSQDCGQDPRDGLFLPHDAWENLQAGELRG
jgi:hypothetical protein